MAHMTKLDPAALPLDVFDLTGTGLEVESLTSNHGMPETGASIANPPCGGCHVSCSCSGCGGCACGEVGPTPV